VDPEFTGFQVSMQLHPHVNKSEVPPASKRNSTNSLIQCDGYPLAKALKAFKLRELLLSYHPECVTNDYQNNS